MTICPYCNVTLSLKDFFKKNEHSDGGMYKFLGDEITDYDLTSITRMWSCPNCHKLLTITEFSF